MGLTAHDFFALTSACDPQTETAFFAALKMRNGTFKLTQTARFAELEEVFSEKIGERASTIRNVLDIGASSGITTVEFAQYLRGLGVDAKLTATDLFITAHIVDIAPALRVLAEPDGRLLQYDIGGLAIRPWIRRLDYVTLAFVPRILARKVLQPRVRAAIDSGRSKPVQLVSPRLAESDNVDMVEDNIMIRSSAFTNRFDLVRAANLLNRNYFSADDLRRAIANIRSYLRGPGALFIVARTRPGDINAGTLFELDPAGDFCVLEQVGGGSEIENLVLGTNADIKTDDGFEQA